MNLQIDDELKQILREWFAPSIAAAKESRVAAKAEMPKPPKKVKEKAAIQRQRSEEHREIYFTLADGRVLSACAASDCFWSADPSQHEDPRYRRRHSDGERNHFDVPDVENDGEGVQEIEVEELSFAGMLSASAVAEDGALLDEEIEVIPQESVDADGEEVESEVESAA